MKTELTCRIDTERETVYMARGNTLVGQISAGTDGEPEFMLYGNQNGIVWFTANDFEVAMDNWNQMQETLKLLTKYKKSAKV